MEHSELSDNSLYKRVINKAMLLIDSVMNDVIKEELMKSVETLPETQIRRIVLYYLEGKTMTEIAQDEGCSKIQYKYCIIKIEKGD